MADFWLVSVTEMYLGASGNCINDLIKRRFRKELSAKSRRRKNGGGSNKSRRLADRFTAAAARVDRQLRNSAEPGSRPGIRFIPDNMFDLYVH